MAILNASGKVIAVSETDDEKVLVTIESAKMTDARVPSFKLTYEFPMSSAAVAAYPLGTLVAMSISTTPPVPGIDVVTATTTLVSSSAPVEVSAPVDVSADSPRPLTTIAAPGEKAEAVFATPAGDIPEPTITDEHPAVVTSSVMANAPIADVKAALGL